MTTLIKVRGYHLDVYQHVNNARYLEFLEEARWEWLDRSGVADWLTQQHLGFIAVNININYRRAAKLGDCLEVTCRMAEISERSAVMEQKVTHSGEGTLVADARITFVCLDLKQQKSVPVSGEIKTFLEMINQQA
ncbi:acyl-CoA thioesterase [Tatumella sp. UBA2305]|uniref:acyl-CoA thioesterase n=1 Tax=Tatumella sp. UBA2305 TaxID=1947647 RepID=UPI0025F59260|nr:thioesterase family protein [Tatumella sp. UBA2305]